MPGTKSWNEIEAELNQVEKDSLKGISKIQAQMHTLMELEGMFRKNLTHVMIQRSRIQTAKELSGESKVG